MPASGITSNKIALTAHDPLKWGKVADMTFMMSHCFKMIVRGSVLQMVEIRKVRRGISLFALLDVSNKTQFALTTNNFLVCWYVSLFTNFHSTKVSTPTRNLLSLKTTPKPNRKLVHGPICLDYCIPNYFLLALHSHYCEGTKVLEVCRPTLAPSCDASQGHCWCLLLPHGPICRCIDRHACSNL